MGESRGGEGSTGRATTVEIARALVQAYERDAREITSIELTFVTTGLYAVSIEATGEPDPERFFLGVDLGGQSGDSSIPYGNVGGPGAEE